MSRLKGLILLAGLFAIIVASANNRNSGAILSEHFFDAEAYSNVPLQFKLKVSEGEYNSLFHSTQIIKKKIGYKSGNLKVNGFLFEPKVSGQRCPVVIFNHPGIGENSKLGTENIDMIYEMLLFAKAGFVVVASQYRGIDGSEGKDEVGGADLDDILNLKTVINEVVSADTSRIFIYGISRGGMMALQAVRKGMPVKAVCTVGAPTDWNMQLKISSNIGKDFWPEFDKNRDAHIRERSAVTWADQINVPVLLIQGGADVSVQPVQTLDLARKFEEFHKLYQLVVFPNDNHEVLHHQREKINAAIEWFQHIRKPSPQPLILSYIRSMEMDEVKKKVDDLRREIPNNFDFSESQLQELGFLLLERGYPKIGLQVLEWNSQFFRSSTFAAECLGYAYLKNGDKTNALKYYQEALKLDSSNIRAKEGLKSIKL
jgi:dienelactone hydrolase